MRTEKTIRSQAKQALKGNWTAAVSGVFVLLAVMFLPEFIYELLCELADVFSDGKLNEGREIPLIIIVCSSFLLAFAVSPFKNGYFRLCYNIARGRSDGLRDVFYFLSGIKLYFKALQFNILIMLKKVLYALIGFAPYIIFKVSEFVFTPGESVVQLYEIIEIVLLILGIALSLLMWIGLFIVEFVFVDNPEADVFTIAKVISNKHLGDYCKLVFTFVLWILSCFFVLPVLYVIPYFTTSLGTTSKWLINLYKEGKTV